MHHTTYICDRCETEMEKKVDMKLENISDGTLYGLNLALDLCLRCREEFETYWNEDIVK